MRLKITWPKGDNPADVSNYKRAQAADLQSEDSVQVGETTRQLGDPPDRLKEFVRTMRDAIQLQIDERRIKTKTRGLPGGGIVRRKLSLEERAKRLIESKDSGKNPDTGEPTNNPNREPETSFPSNPSLGHP